mmetsp:Transcript_6221/g.10691  ORF Transcript_6221/g.10691 Transcript_6221/m.10691 type:complete len:468 (-) Transcript_6221:296-1699(-)
MATLNTPLVDTGDALEAADGNTRPLLRRTSSGECGSFYRRYRGRGYVPPPRNQEWYHAAAILVAELVGTGVLALPHTFAVVGVTNGVLLLVFFAIFSWYSGILLHRLQEWFPHGITYGDMAFEVIGLKGQTIVFGFIYVAFFGNLAIYILTCAEALQNVFFDYPEWCKWWFTVVTAMFLFPFCQLRTLHHISFAAAASGIAIFGALIIILVLAFNDLQTGRVPSGVPVSSHQTFLKTMASMTTAIFSFGGQGLFFETMAEMKRPKEFPRAVTSTTLLIFVIYLIVSLVCYYVYGEHVQGNILFALPDGQAKRVAGILLFFHVCISYVLAQQVIGRAIHVRLNPDHVDEGTKKEKMQWMAITVFLLVLSFLIANGIPIFHHLMGFVGAISTAPLTFGIPAYMVLRATKMFPRRSSVTEHEIHPLEYPVLYFFMLLSIYLMTVGVASNTAQIIEAWDKIGQPFACHPSK